jgi:LysM repeat protein
MSLQPRHPGSRRLSHVRRFAAPAILIFTFATFGATISRAQDQQDPQSQQDQSVAEAARKERARKEEIQKRAKHVYTEEDLKHPNILTPEDRAQVEAKRNECAQKNNCSPADAQNSPATLDANSPAAGTSSATGTSLGEVARQLRKQKELEALKPKQTEPFHLPIGTPALASPILPERPAVRPPVQPVLRPKTSSPKTPSNIFRRDPFSSVPVPAPAPARPEIRKPEVRRPEVARPEIQPALRENIRPAIQPNVGGSVLPRSNPGVHPNVSSARPHVREEIVPAVRPDFSKAVRPVFHARRPLAFPPQPKVFFRPALPTLLVEPMQPAAPVADAVEPAAPVSTIHPAAASVIAAPAQPVATQRTISVKSGDSLWKLAQQNLGRGNRWHELLSVNPSIADPNQIRAGAHLVLPAAAAAAVDRSNKSDGANTIKVRKGDTLWTLAKSNLGRSSAWSCLAAANPSLRDPNLIYTGQSLILPAACTYTPGNPAARATP